MNSFYFANVAGLWALLGIPVVLLIHLLQHKTRRIQVSTLFLLQNLAPESVPGRTLRRLRSSLPLWLQLVLVLVLAWLLAEPRWLRPESSQTVVLILDSSASMSAFRDRVIAGLAEELPQLEKGAARTDWVLLESDHRKGALYQGRDRAALLASLEAWKPLSGEHDWAPVFELARTFQRGQGRLVAVSDHDRELPAEVALLARGEALPNVGFAGLTVDREKGQHRWRATVRNYSAQPARRNWRVESGSAGTAAQELELAPRETKILSGTFPQGKDRLELVLQEDAFSPDDRLPLLIPQAKPLSFYLAATGEAGGFFQKIAQMAPALKSAPEPAGADFAVLQRRWGEAADGGGNALVFFARENPQGGYNLQPVAADDHPLVRDINWRGLLCNGPGLLEVGPSDRVLLWQDNRPLVLLKQAGKNRRLVFNFDFENSNAMRLPSFVILINRFVESLRADKVAPSKQNYETGQPLKLMADAGSGPLSYAADGGKEPVEIRKAAMLRAPAGPGFFRIEAGPSLLLEGAGHFGDPREADLNEGASLRRLLEISPQNLRRNSEADPWVSLWLLALGGLLVWSWWWQSPLRKTAGGRR